MKSQRKPVEIFSFSFLDVIACGVGVILFITILAISQTVKSGDPELIKQLQESQATEATLDRMNEELEQNQKKQKMMEEANQRIASLVQEIAKMESHATLAIEYEKLRQQHELMKMTIQQTAALSKTLPNRSPVARSTSRTPMVYLAFAGNDVLRLAVKVSGEWLSKDYDITDTYDETVLRASGSSLSVKKTMTEPGPVTVALNGLDTSQHYIECYVEPDAFEDFVRLRTMLQNTGFDVGYLFVEDTSVLTYSTSGRSSKVQ